MSAPESFGDIPVDDDEEPAVLGAAATIEDTKKKRTRQRVRRRQQATPTAGGSAAMEFVYEPHVAVMPPLRSYFADVWERRAFMSALARSDIRGGRSNTTLGSLWALLDPLFMAAIYFFLFTVIRDGGGRGADFIPLIISGILMFQVTGGAITAGGSAVTRSKALMLNSTFPRAILPLTTVYKLVIEFIPAIPIILFGQLVFNRWSPAKAYHVEMLWFIPTFAIQVLTAVGLALIISTAVVFLRDVGNLMTYVSRVLFFSTPIIYPLDLLPDSILQYVRWQPIFGTFSTYQRILTGQAPNYADLGISLGWSIVLVIFGFWLFLRYERQFASKI